MKNEYDINTLLNDIDFTSNKLNFISKKLVLSNQEIEVLERYKIDYKKCQDLKEVLCEIEEVLGELEEDGEDLE